MPLVTENLVARIGQQQEGFLIRPQDWNLLVQAVAGVEAALTERLDALQQHMEEQFTRVGVRMDALEQRVDGVEAGVAELHSRTSAISQDVATLRNRVEVLTQRAATLEARVEPVVANAYHVTMQTPRLDYALGEMAELVARIDYLPGAAPGPLAGRWITFVCTSGTFRPADGYVSRGGVGDRTIAVQTDARGVAKVRLQSDLVDDMPLESAEELSAALQTRVGSMNRSVSDLILRSDTPEDEDVKAAYGVLTGKYDREDSSLRSYVDSYYLKHDKTLGPAVQGPRGVRPQWIQRWRDYRITVLAFATDDADPTTADSSRGTCSIQVVFRDWVRSWMVIDYWSRVRDTAVTFRDRLTPKVGLTLEGSVDLMRREVTEIVKDRGVVGRLRDYQAIDVAFDTLTVANRPEFLPTLSKSMKAAVGIQRSLEQNPAGILGQASQELVFQSLTRSATPTRDDRVDGLSITLDELNQEFGTRADTLGGRVEELSQRQTEYVRADELNLRLEATVPQQIDSRLQSFQSALPAQIDSRIQSVVPQQIDARVQTLQSTLPAQIDGRIQAVVPPQIETQVTTRLDLFEKTYDTRLTSLGESVDTRLSTLTLNYDTQIRSLSDSVDSRLTTFSRNYDTRLNSFSTTLDRTTSDVTSLRDTQFNSLNTVNTQLFELSRTAFTSTATPVISPTRDIIK
jgi:hypothetical protein